MLVAINHGQAIVGGNGHANAALFCRGLRYTSLSWKKRGQHLLRLALQIRNPTIPSNQAIPETRGPEQHEASTVLHEEPTGKHPHCEQAIC